jgi:hypothetical protein
MPSNVTSVKLLVLLVEAFGLIGRLSFGLYWLSFGLTRVPSSSSSNQVGTSVYLSTAEPLLVSVIYLGQAE